MNSQPTSAASQCSTAFHWKVTLLCLLTFPVLMALGFWQLDRAEQKRAREAALDAVRTQPPATLPGTDLAAIEEQRRLLLQGHYLTGRNWLLDNRQRDGQVGYEVITPFELSDGRILLVNRGWVAASAEPIAPTRQRRKGSTPCSPAGRRPVTIRCSTVAQRMPAGPK